MTEEELFELYNGYFKSGSYKLESNDYVGCFGLGSKSPFSYTKNFSVTSYKDGVAYICSAFINDDGVPNLALMSKFETDEPNGVEIKIPVRSYDTEQWKNEAKEVYKYFKMVPPQIQIEKRESALSGDGWRLVSGYGSFAHAIIGNIAYEINRYSLTGLTSQQSNLINANIELDFQVGELDVTLSREGLEYTDKTQNAIKNKINTIISEATILLEQEIIKQPTYWAARNYIQNSLNGDQLKILRTICEADKLTWNNISIFKQIKIEDPKEPNLCLQYVEYRTWGKRNPIKDSSYIQPNDCYQVFIEDNRGGLSRVKNWIRDNQKSAFLFKNYDETTKTYEVQGVSDYLITTLGCSTTDIKLTSSLPAPVKTYVKRTTRVGRKTPVFVYQTTSSSYENMCWCETEVDTTIESGVYIKMNAHKIIIGKEHYHPEKLRLIYESSLGITKLYGVRKEAWKAFKNNPNWVELGDYIKDYVQKNVGVPYYYTCALDKINYTGLWNSLKESGVSDSTWSTFINLYHKYKKGGMDVGKRNAIQNFALIFHILIPTTTIEALDEDKVLKQYPLLGEVNTYDWKNLINPLQEFLNCVDYCRSKGIIK